MNKKGIELWSINKWLRKVGIVIVVATGEFEPTRIWLERSKTYDNRCEK